MARWKARGWLPISANWTFFASSYGWGAMSKYWSKLRCLKGGSVTLSANFRGKGRSSTNEFWRHTTRVPGLSHGVVCVILRLAVLIQYRRVTHRQTDTHTNTRSWLLPAQSELRAGKIYVWKGLQWVNDLEHHSRSELQLSHGHNHFLLAVSSNDSILHRFRDITHLQCTWLPVTVRSHLISKR